MKTFVTIGAMTDSIEAVRAELGRALDKFPRPQASAHEGYAVILEELDEAWDAIKANDIPHAKKEMVQVAAMALRFILEVQVPQPKAVPSQANLPAAAICGGGGGGDLPVRGDGNQHSEGFLNAFKAATGYSHPQHPDPTIGRPR